MTDEGTIIWAIGTMFIFVTAVSIAFLGGLV